MKVLITGATGYVGKNLINALLKDTNHQLYAVVRQNGGLLPSGVTNVPIDADFEEHIAKINPNVVIHLASFLTARAEIADINKLIDSNITFGTLLLNALRTTNLDCFINVGSFSEYHDSDGVLNPTYLYAATKTAFRPILDYYATVHQFKVLHVIPYTIYGGVDTQKKIIDILFDSIDTEDKIKISEGLQQLDFVHVDDVVRFFKQLIDRVSMLKHNEVLHLGTGHVHNLRDVALIIEKITKKNVNVEWGAYPPRARDTVYACASVGKLKEKLNWQPIVELEEGLNLKYKQIQNGYSEH